jgi:hypothetical protein
MQTIASMREYINDYVRNRTLQQVGKDIIKGQFDIPFSYDILLGYNINFVPMNEAEAKAWIQGFFEDLDTSAVMHLYHKLAV